MTAEVLNPSPEELREWREAALARVASTREELETRESQAALNTNESNALATVRGIDFLLGEGA